MQIQATIVVPVTVNWTHTGEPSGQQQAMATVTVTREVSSPDGWAAVGNWQAGQMTATITVGGQ